MIKSRGREGWLPAASHLKRKVYSEVTLLFAQIYNETALLGQRHMDPQEIRKTTDPLTLVACYPSYHAYRPQNPNVNPSYNVSTKSPIALGFDRSVQVIL